MSPRAGALVLLALLVAGCTSQPSQPSAAQQAVSALRGSQPEPPLGSIDGVVLSPSLEPVVLARVTLMRENVSTRTDAAGAFHFMELRASTYLLSVEAEGFVTRSFYANTMNGAATAVNVTLERAPKKEPFFETRELAGFLSCGLDVTTPAVPERVDCASADANHRDSFEIGVGPDLRMVVLELVWSVKDNPGASRLGLSAKTLGFGASDASLGNVTGAGYARIVVSSDIASKYYTDGGSLRASIRLVSDGSPPAEAALQTKFTLYATAFYVSAGPADFTVIKRSA